jgi:hypothetical protein
MSKQSKGGQPTRRAQIVRGAIEGVAARGQAHLRQRTIILAASGALLTWLVLSSSLATYLAEDAPEAALWLNPSEPTALLNLADRELNRSIHAGTVEQTGAWSPTRDGAGPPAAADGAHANANFAEFNSLGAKRPIDLSAVRAWAGASLMNAPLDARGLRILGQVAPFTGNDVDAAKFMRAASDLSLHESIAVDWLLMHSAEVKDYKAALRYADIILRTLPGFDPYVMPILALVARDESSRGLIEDALVKDPPWRSNFLQQLPKSVGDERVPLELLLALRQTAHPPAKRDVNSYLEFLVQHQLYQLAYYTWLQFLPAQELRSVGLLYNGNFDAAPSGSPFDWRIEQGAGVAIDIQEQPDTHGAQALIVDFEIGRVEYHSVRQMIMLAPGQYRFEALYQGMLGGPRGLKWRVTCAESANRPFAESDMMSGTAAAWQGIAFDFTVPEENCGAQYISLDLDARMPSEELITGSISFKDLRISRPAGASGTAATQRNG